MDVKITYFNKKEREKRVKGVILSYKLKGETFKILNRPLNSFWNVKIKASGTLAVIGAKPILHVKQKVKANTADACLVPFSHHLSFLFIK